MFPNLEAEMARGKITQSSIAALLGITPTTLSFKLNGKSPILLKECVKIKNGFSQIKHWITYLQPITKKTGNHGIPFGRSEGISMRPARPDRRKGEMAMIIVSTIVSAITAKIVATYYFKKVDGYVKKCVK